MEAGSISNAIEVGFDIDLSELNLRDTFDGSVMSFRHTLAYLNDFSLPPRFVGAKLPACAAKRARELRVGEVIEAIRHGSFTSFSPEVTEVCLMTRCLSLSWPNARRDHRTDSRPLARVVGPSLGGRGRASAPPAAK